jgi:hypothetical protein
MNIQEIYGYQKPLFDRLFADFYNKFEKDLENDPLFTLADDEMTELFNELVIMYMKDTTPEAEWERIIDLMYE